MIRVTSPNSKLRMVAILLPRRHRKPPMMEGAKIKKVDIPKINNWTILVKIKAAERVKSPKNKQAHFAIFNNNCSEAWGFMKVR